MKRSGFYALAAMMLLYCINLNAQSTYCNPLNLDYGYCPIPNFTEWGKHRATADPVIVMYKGDYYLFSTNQWGYLSQNHFSSLIIKCMMTCAHRRYGCKVTPCWCSGQLIPIIFRYG